MVGPYAIERTGVGERTAGGSIIANDAGEQERTGLRTISRAITSR